MTKSQIKAELRRSACEDQEPYWQCNVNGEEWDKTFREYRKLPFENVGWMNDDDCRTFFLLVAEAL